MTVRARFGTAILFVLFVACSKDEPKPPIVINAMARPLPADPPAASEDEETKHAPQPTFREMSNDTPPPPSVIAPTSPSANGPRKNSVDPDLLVVESGRKAGESCFPLSEMEPGTSRTVSINVTVLPTGTVSRAEVSGASRTETEFEGCLKRVGTSLMFSDKTIAGPDASARSGDLRQFTIDIKATSSR